MAANAVSKIFTGNLATVKAAVQNYLTTNKAQIVIISAFGRDSLQASVSGNDSAPGGAYDLIIDTTANCQTALDAFSAGKTFVVVTTHFFGKDLCVCSMLEVA